MTKQTRTNILYFLLIFSCTTMATSCSTKVVGGYGFQSRNFVRWGWIKVDESEIGENTPFNRVLYEKKHIKNIDKFILKNGMPDYYYTTKLWDVYYGYRNMGIIYHFDMSSNGRILDKFHYSKMTNKMPQMIIDEFKNAKKNNTTNNKYTKKNNTLPTIVISNPKLDRGIKIISNDKINIIGKAFDDDGIYEVTVNDTVAQLRSNGYFSVNLPLSMGENIVSVKATDNKFNSAYKKFSLHREASNSPQNKYAKEKRLALVIGNSNYTYGRSLANPINDARALKKTLEDLGFMVIKYENSNQKTMKKAIDEFGKKLKDCSIGLFFYAGHGVQFKGNNYLIPVDAKLENENDTEYDTVRADRVLAKMESSRSKINIVILDACRNNPFERRWRRGSNRNGLAFMNAPSGTIIAYATSPGNTASDGNGFNGLYTSALLKHIKTKGITIEQMFKRVRATTMELSNNKQVPWESTSLKGDFYFKNE